MIALEIPTDQSAPPVPVRITVEYDDDHTPWGEPEIIEEETRQINALNWAAYSVIVRAVGPVEREESLHGCVVGLTEIGTYEDATAIPDAHLREVAEDLAARIRDSYLSDLVQARDEINALISRLEQGPNSA
ncbi:hypothetical protein [Streptomyces sp. NPDC088775]|uniref:hypothetical protein n=1 Tax=Streptomyces sp. NPDC088775 TaxID=3365896 RepID=UPI00380C67D8